MEKESFRRQVKGWREELKTFGKRLDAIDPDNEDQVGLLATSVRDLRVRVQSVCRELNVRGDDNDSIAALVRRIEERIE